MNGRRSIKFEAFHEGQGFGALIVFAPDEEQAIDIARERYEIPEDVEVTVKHVREHGHGHLGSGRKQLAGATTAVHPHAQQEAQTT